MKHIRTALFASSLVLSCTTSQPVSQTTNATIAKQVALADEAYELGRYGTAASRYRQALLFARSQDDPRLIAPLLHNLGTALQHSHLCDDARVMFQEAFDLYQSLDESRGKLMSLLGKGTCEHASGLPEAKTTLQQVLILAQELNQVTVASRAASGLAAVALAQDAPDKAAYVTQALDLARTSKSPSALGVAHYNQGRLYERASEAAKALEAFRHSASAYRAIDDHAGLASALYQQAVVSAQLQDEPLETANLYQRAAHASASARQLQRSLEAFQKAANYFEKAGRKEQADLCRERAEALKGSIK